MMNHKNRTRREFLKSGAAVAAAVGFPYFVPGSALGKSGSTSPSNTITMGCIGIGGQGIHNIKAFMNNSDLRILAVADPAKSHHRGGWEEGKRIVDEKYGNNDCRTYTDHRDLIARDDIDTVMIASPDHWHVKQAVDAARAKKDMYVEKPLGLCVGQGQALRRTIHRYGNIFQFGTQQRSSVYFRQACELVHNGYIGKLKKITVGTPPGKSAHTPPVVPVPEDFDYKMWVGPAQWMPYRGRPQLPSCGNWGSISNFGLGLIGVWGVHHLDIAQWGNASDDTGPLEVQGWGKFPEEGLYDCATHWSVDFKYANGVVVRFTDSTQNPQGVTFEGTEGSVFVKRGFIDAKPKSLLSTKIRPDEKHVTFSNDHHRNFLDCVKTREQTASPIDVAVRSDALVHLTDATTRLGRKLKWNPETERFINDAEANRMLSREMRHGWHL